MNDVAHNAERIEEFIQRWKNSGAAERANYSLFLTQLCDLLGVPQPDPTTPDLEQNAYVFERDVTFDQGDGTTTDGRIDLYKRGCFVLEAKHGSDQVRVEEAAARGRDRSARGARAPWGGNQCALGPSR